MKNKPGFILGCLLFYTILIILFYGVWSADHDEAQLNALKNYAYNVHELLYPNNDELLSLALNTKSVSKFMNDYRGMILFSNSKDSGLLIEDQNDFQVYYFNIVGSDKWDSTVNEYISAWISRNAAQDLNKFIDEKSNAYYATKVSYYVLQYSSEYKYWGSLMKTFYADVPAYYASLIIAAIMGLLFIIVNVLATLSNGDIKNSKIYNRASVENRYFRCVAQISLVKELMKEYKDTFYNCNDDYGEEGVVLVIWTNVYLAFCYLIEWIFAEENVSIPERDVYKYMAVVEENIFFNCIYLTELSDFSGELWKAENLSGNLTCGSIHSLIKADDVIEKMYITLEYFRRLYHKSRKD